MENSIVDCKSQIASFVNEIQSERGKRTFIEERIEENDITLKELEKQFLDTEKAQLIIQLVAKETQENIKYNIENIVTMAMESVFQEEPYKFVMDFEIKSGKTECNLSFERNGNKMNPMNSSGYGAVNIASFALRVSLWAISKKYEGLFILDEPFRDLSMFHQPLAGKMLKELSEKLGIQFIVATHRMPLIEYADNVHRVKRRNDVSVVRQIKSPSN